MSMHFEVSEDQAAEAVTNAIVNSVLGEKLREAIEAEVKKAIGPSDSYRAGIVEQVVREQVRTAVVEICTERRAEIQARVGELLGGAELDRFITALYERGLDRL